MTQPKSVTVIGSLNVDFTVLSDHLPQPGESVVGREFFQAFGGKGANQAVGISRLGIDQVRFVGAVGGDDIGSAGLQSLQREGVSTEWVRVIPEVKSGVALIMIDAQGENCISAAPGANHCLDEQSITAMPDHVFAESSLLVVCQEIPLEAIAVAVHRAKKFSVPVLFNPAPPNPRLVESGVLQLVDFLTPNETEVTAMTGITIKGGTDVVNQQLAMQRIKELGVRHIAITLGGAGCYVYEQAMGSVENSILLPATPTHAIDTTAAGDSFNAAVAVGLVEGKSFLDACRWANTVAAICVTRKGAQPSLPKRSEVSSSASGKNI